ILKTTELLEEVSNDLVHLETEPDGERLNRISWAFHTLKGTCGFLGFLPSRDLAQAAEDLLNKLRNHDIGSDSAITDVLLETIDWFKDFIEDVKERVDKEYEIDLLLQKLEAARFSAPGSAGDDKLAPEDGKLLEPEAAAYKSAQVPPSEGKSPKSMETVKVDLGQLDNLMDLAGELAISRNQLEQACTNLSATRAADAARDNLDQAGNSLERITAEIQKAVISMRMLPISDVFRKYRRVVRDLAHERGKQVELVMVGEDTELDRSVIEAVSDPLLHLVRNAVDHGVEPPEEREAAGKPEQGTVILRASREDNQIIIEVEDDGGGMESEKLVEKALEKGIITPSEAESISHREKLNIIFRTGFSTATKVTDVSGLGVGLDLVHANVSKLNGTIDIDTKIGAGTRITIKLPLTPTIITGLKAGVWDEDYIIPFANIVKTVSLNKSDIARIQDQRVFQFRDSEMPALSLDEWVRVPGRPERGNQKQYAVVVSVAEFRCALVVTGLKGQEEVVVKPLGQALGRIPGIAGGTIGGDGLITLVLDVPELISHIGAG
ncbi:MAG: chemotaxis protein CheA, partial [Fidelibacterota bacterium]